MKMLFVGGSRDLQEHEVPEDPVAYRTLVATETKEVIIEGRKVKKNVEEYLWTWIRYDVASMQAIYLHGHLDAHEQRAIRKLRILHGLEENEER